MANNAADSLHIEKLVDATSFQVWKFQVTIIFKSQKSWNVVNGEESKPENDGKATEAWLKKDTDAQRIIVTTIDKKLITMILNCETSSQMFSKLCSLFEGQKEQKMTDLYNDFFLYKYKKGQDMTSFVSEMENIVHKLKSLGQEITDEMVISRLLVALPDYLKHFPTAWDSTPSSEKTLDNLTVRLIKEEARRSSAETETVPVAFKAGSFQRKSASKSGAISKRCFVCNGPHIARFCPNKNRNRSSGPLVVCTICKRTNHSEDDCYFRNKPSKNSEKVAFLSFDNIGSKEQFIIDSGCTQHMCKDRKFFSSLVEKEEAINTAKHEETIVSQGSGNLETEEFMLKNSLYIPQLTSNLISVNSITKNDGVVVFTKKDVKILKNDEVVLKGMKQPNGLYTVDASPVTSSKSAFLAKKENAVDLHKKMGHPSIDSMKRMLSLVDGINLQEKDLKDLPTVCEVCVKAKQTRFPFKTNRERATRPLQILHTDVIGPIETETWDGKRYILSVLDDATQFASVFLMRRKSEAFDFIKNFVVEAEAQHKQVVSKIRSDNGGEFSSDEMKRWCKQRGIRQDQGISHTPQLNGRAERLGRTIMSRVRALLLDSGMKDEMWGEAAQTAAYLMNRTPSSTIDVTPAEKWFGNRPNVSKIHVFGCIAYAKKLGHLKKLEPRSEKLYLVGYTPVGYRLWNPATRKIVNARDVIFSAENSVKTSTTSRAQVNIWNVDQGEEEEESPHESDLENIQNGEDGSSHDSDSAEIQDDPKKRKTSLRPQRDRKIPQKYDDFVLLSYKQAISGPDKDKWAEAIEEEMRSLQKNRTWKLVDENSVQNQDVLSSRWVFRVKDNGKHKARLVIRGCEQDSSYELEEIFSPVVSANSLRTMFALAAAKNFHIYKFDVKTAFLHGELKGDVFMKMPEGFEVPGKLCKLEKALYGLKCSPMIWNEKFSRTLKMKGFEEVKAERCLFRNVSGSVMVSIYVDDGLVIGKDQDELIQVLASLKEEFDMTIEENPSFFLGMEISRDSSGIKLSQEKYLRSVLQKFRMSDAKPVVTPGYENKIYDRSEEEIKYPYREAVGSLLHLSSRTRPDISNAVNIVSRHIEHPCKEDVEALKRILRYLAGTPSRGIKFSSVGDVQKIDGYSDSDYAGDQDTRRSTSGYIILFAGGPISD
ncbi:Reverse transcriptase (RNA-dependent DNA polymerase) [Nesidiocoris tenuis]|uniref:Reverse transcriptase (RNA-dependent DNA polymerase) n=1 Tax=Nesidiocoris tenuis TaxID=355587 RepID=A0ABN7BCQ2_9HEMI|nr:Reverse transcriptase (RNA-dependent DNA polymerase) [Nesidiocoris tenuis]